MPARFFGKLDIIDKADPLEHIYHIIRAYEYVKGAKMPELTTSILVNFCG